jgi:hypothetical protein
VTETVLKKIFPCQQDLDLLAHVREVNINDTELANGDDDGWLAVVLANRLPVFDTANNKSVRYMACLVNVEGQLPSLPKPEPPIDHFTFELAQDWSVLAAIDPHVDPDIRVMGGINAGNINLPIAGGLKAAKPKAAAAPQATSAAGVAHVGVSLDGAATMKETPTAAQWSSATEKIAAVALDPDAKHLVRDAMAVGFRYPIEQFALEKVYRFPVLAHWSFTTNEGATFETLMEDLDVGLLGTIPEPAPDAAPAPAGPDMVETGHIDLSHRTRRGDPVRAWYRGPLVPFPTDRDPTGTTRPLLAHSADQLRRVIPDGREDLSLAAAFEIGRLLGLSQLSIVSALLRFRHEQFGAGRVHEILSRMIDFALPALIDQPIDLGRFVALQMIGDLAKNPANSIGPRRPVADPGRALNVEGDLDAIIAEGLGFTLGVVRELGQQIGVLAALQQTQVPIANPKAQVPLDKNAIAGLRGALSAELENTIRVAAPNVVKGTPRVARTTRAARATRGKKQAAAPQVSDALDDLIEHAAANARSEEGES